MGEREIPSRAKAPIYDWRVPSDIITKKTATPIRHFLSSYLAGRELEAGEDIINALSEAFIRGVDGLYWKKLSEKVQEVGSSKSTARNALRKLERQRLVVGGSKSLAHGRVTMWRLSWLAFAGVHAETAKMARKFQKDLEDKKAANLPLKPTEPRSVGSHSD